MSKMTVKDILALPHTGGSGSGNSHYMKVLACPYMAWLDSQMEGSDEMGSNAQVGVYYHSLMEHYFGGTLDDSDDPTLVLDKDQLDAYRLYQAYKSHFPADGYGKVLAVEQQFDDASEFVGVDPFTARLDMVVEVDNPAAVKALRPEMETLEKGVYIWDHKSVSSKPSNPHIQYGKSLQCIIYQAIYRELMGVQPQGMVFDIAVRYKPRTPKSTAEVKKQQGARDKFIAVAVPFPSESEIEFAKEQYRHAKEILETNPKQKRVTACLDYGGCRWLKNGVCRS